MVLNHEFRVFNLIFILFLAIFIIGSFNSVYATELNNQNHDLSICDSNSSISLDDSDFGDLAGATDLNDENYESDLDSDLNLIQSPELSTKTNLKDSNSEYLDKDTSNKIVLSANKLSKVILTTNNLTASYKSKNFTAKLTDSNKNPIVGVKIDFTISSKTYQRTTDKNGIARLMINLLPGNYSISTKFAGDKNYSSALNKNTIKISKKKLSINSSNLSKKYGNSDRFQVKISDNGVGIANITVALVISSKTYLKKTNENGIASLAISLKIGKYTIKSYVYTNKAYYSNTNTNNITVKSQNPYNLTVLNWGTKGNIKKNSVLMNNIPKSSFTNAIIAACNNGTPLIQFGNGSGKKVFVLAGVHGNELASQAAAFKLANSIYNSKSKINGTVYIVPVLCPKMTESNTRYYKDVNLNGVADKKGTVSYKLVSYAKSLKVDAVGDFHCTRPNGDPGKNAILGTSSPTASSASLAKYISKETGYSKIIYEKAGEEYPGAVEDVLNLAGITSVTCESLTPHGKIASGSVGVSLNMMKTLLRYYGMTVS